MNIVHIEAARKIIDNATTIFWFMRDLRLHDNAGLFHAFRNGKNVVPVFIFDTDILEKLEDKYDRRVDFIHQALQKLSTEIQAWGGSLVVLQGVPEDIFRNLNPGSVYANNDYEPYALQRDQRVKDILEEKNDLFALVFSLPSIGILYYFTVKDYNPYMISIGLGIFCYGFFYLVFHDIIVHQRLKWRPERRSRYLQRMIHAHYIHHSKHSKEGCEAFGFLFAPKKYEPKKFTFKKERSGQKGNKENN